MRKFYRNLLLSSHWRIHRRTVAHATDRRMHPSHQVPFSVILKLGHTQRNLRWGVSSATDRLRGTVAELMKSTRLDPAGPFLKSDRLYFPLHIPPYYFLIPISSPLFSTSTLPLTDHCSQNPPKPYNYHPLVGAAAVGVYLANWIILHLFFFPPFPRYVSLNLYSFILHFGLVVSISLVLSRILFPLYD